MKNQFIIYILFGLLAMVNGAFVGCNSTQQSQLQLTLPAAKLMVLNAATYLNSPLSSVGSPRYTTWFGPFDTDRHNTVAQYFDKLNQFNFDTYTFDCTCNTPYLGYVSESKGILYLCSNFWNMPVTGTDSKAGQMIIFARSLPKNGGSFAAAAGQASCKRLAQNYPDTAIHNGQNHKYFAENYPPLL